MSDVSVSDLCVRCLLIKLEKVLEKVKTENAHFPKLVRAFYTFYHDVWQASKYASG